MLCCARLCLNQVDLQPLMILLAVKHHRNIARFWHDLACCCCHPVDNVASERLSRPVNNWLQDADFTCMIRWISAMPSSMSSDNLYTSIILFDGYSSRANRTGDLTKCKPGGGKSHLDLGTRLTGLRSRCTYVSCCTDLRSCGICACHQKHTQHNTTKDTRDSKVRSVTCSRPSFDQHRPSEARGIGTGFEQDSGIALSKALRQDSQSRFSLSHTRSHPILLLLPLQYSVISTS